MTAVLEVSYLCKSFGGIAVTRDVNLELHAGARHALIGPNGAGKSTLIGLLSGVLRPDRGSIHLMGADVTGKSTSHRVKQGLVRTFQVNSLFGSLSVLENILLAVCEHRGAGGQVFRDLGRRTDLIDEAVGLLSQVGLEPYADQRVNELPYGRQRLVEIALALALEPKVLLLDEPAAGIPSGDVPCLLDAIDRLPTSIAILMIEHDMALVRHFAKEVTVLVAGEVLKTGRPEAIMADPEVRKVYLGEGGHNRYTEGVREYA